MKTSSTTSPTLNEIPVLDKGYVALFSASVPNSLFRTLQKEFFRGSFDEKLLHIPIAHLKIKCPLFVQLTFAEYGLSYVTQRSSSKPEAFVPTVAEVNAQTLEASEGIQRDIEQTTAALLLNPKAYQMDNCDIFISQVISPVSVYNTLIVSGSLGNWMRFISQKSLPAPIEAYRKVIEEVLIAEWDIVKELKNENNSKTKSR